MFAFPRRRVYNRGMKKKRAKDAEKPADRHLGKLTACHLPPEIRARLEEMALINRRSMATEIRISIEERLEREEEKRRTEGINGSTK